MERITELANQLGQAIKETEAMKKMSEIEEKYNSDETLCALVGEYNALSQSLTEAYGQGKDGEEAVKSIENRITELYNTITENPVMIEYQAAQHAVNDLMAKVNDEITFGITGERPEHSCSGNCTSCSGCH